MERHRMSTSQEFYLIFVDNDRFLPLSGRVLDTFQLISVMDLPWFLRTQSPPHVCEFGGDGVTQPCVGVGYRKLHPRRGQASH